MMAAPYGAKVAICALAPLKPFSEVKVGKKAESAAPVICWQMFIATAVSVSRGQVALPQRLTKHLLPSGESTASVLPVDLVAFRCHAQ